MKPMIFQVDSVFEDFRENSEIATFRKQYPDDHEFWVRRSRTGEKKFEAVIEKVERASQAELKPFYTAQGKRPTGFETTKQWIDTVCEMYDGCVPSGWIIWLEKTRGGNQ